MRLIRPRSVDTFSALLLVVGIGAMAAPAEAARQAAAPTKTTASSTPSSRAAGSQPRRRSPHILRSRRAPARPGSSVRGPRHAPASRLASDRCRRSRWR